MKLEGINVTRVSRFFHIEHLSASLTTSNQERAIQAFMGAAKSKAYPAYEQIQKQNG